MARFIRNVDGEVLEGNTYYWRITTKLLPEDVKIVHRIFKLHGTTWKYFVCIYEGFLCAAIKSVCTDIAYLDRSFHIRAGIVGDDLKEIAAINICIIALEKLISCSQLDSMLLTNKSLYLFVKIEQKSENGRKIKNRKQKIERDFKELLLSGKNSDVTIELKHKKFNCHKCILDARSPVFAAMFGRDMEGNDVVIIEDAEPDAFQEFLLYLYSGNCDLLSWKNIEDLYKLADRFCVEDMKIVCSDEIKQNINTENFFEFFKLSRLHNDFNIAETVIQFFLKKSKKIVRSKNWVTYLSENPVECHILLTAVADKLT